MPNAAPSRADSARRLTGYAGLSQYLGGTPEGTLRARVSQGRIPHIRISARSVLFDLDAIDAWLASRARPGTP